MEIVERKVDRFGGRQVDVVFNTAIDDSFIPRRTYKISAVWPVSGLGNPRRDSMVVYHSTIMEAIKKAKLKFKGATISVTAV